jgi:hypothetical protein
MTNENCIFDSSLDKWNRIQFFALHNLIRKSAYVV